MVYRKYIKRGDKIFGPYYYKSYREGDRIKKIYLGSDLHHEGSVTPHIFIGIAALSFLIAIFLLFLNFSSTGRISLELNNLELDKLDGKIKLNLEHGEFIPKDSRIVITLDNESKDYALEEIISGEITSGDFFVKGFDINGSGEGYGIMGEIISYPAINFDLKISKISDSINQELESNESNDGQDKVENDINEKEKKEIENKDEKEVEDAIEGEAEEIFIESDKKSVGESSEIRNEGEDEKKKQNLESGITGALISESEIIIQGETRKDKDFTYNLNDDERAEIVSGSVKVDGKNFDDSLIKLTNDKNKIIVSSDFSLIERGFGEEYLNEEILTLTIDLSKFNFEIEGDSKLNIKLIYNNLILEEINTKLSKAEFEINESLENETSLLNEFNISIDTIQYGAVLGKPVKWRKNIKLDEAANLSVEIPASSSNVSIVKITDEGEAVVEANVGISGNVVLSEESDFFGFLNKFTGFATSEEENIETKIVEINEPVKEVEIEYETPAPYAIEEEFEDKKIVKIIGPEDIHYENVLAFTELSEELNAVNPENIRVFWIESNEYIIPLNVEDLDENGIYDYVEWVVPRLSNQTFEIILITGAEHLDNNRVFIENIYDLVKERDQIWTEPIPSGDYVRVTFEKNLSSEKDITIYAKSSYPNSNIEVYEKDGEEIIATFTQISEDGMYKIFLDNLGDRTQDTFDLKINGEIEFDYIVDPDVTSCQALTTADSLFSLTQNISSAGTCFFITADGITLDGNRFIVGYGENNSANTNGIRTTGSNNTIIKNITIEQLNATGASKHAFNSATRSFNLTVTNVTIRANGSAVTGIRIVNTNGTIIRNNDINMLGTGGSNGISAVGSDYIIESNYINNSGTADSIAASQGSNYSIRLNKIITNGGGISATSVTSSIIEFNNISANTKGIEITSSSSVLLINNNVTANDSAVGIEISSSSNNITNNSIYVINTGGVGVDFQSADISNNIFRGNIVKTNGTGSPGIRVQFNNLIFEAYDGIFNASTGNDLEVGANVNGGVWNFTNITGKQSSFNNVSWASFANGTLNVHWYIDVFANYTNGSVAPGANITVYDKNNNLRFSILTDSNGNIPKQRLIEYIRTNATNITYFSNYTINASRSDGRESIVQSWNMSANRRLAFSFDTSAPLVSINRPENVTYNTLPIFFNFTLNEAGICNYSLNSGSLNITMSANSTNTGFNASNASISDGFYTVKAYCEDNAGNTNYTVSQTFTVDRTLPLVTINQPTPAGVNFSVSNVTFNVSLNENGDTCYYTLDQGRSNVSMTRSGNRHFNATNISIADGDYSVNYYCNDSAGSLNSTSFRIFSIDTRPPIVLSNNISSPLGGNNYSEVNTGGLLKLNVSIVDATTGIESVIFNITNSTGWQNASIIGTNTIGVVWNSTLNTSHFPDGDYNVSIIVNDSAGNINNTALVSRIKFDNTGPSGTLTCTPNPVVEGESMSCSCLASDVTSGINSSASAEANPSTVGTGQHSTSCSFSDLAGNTGSASTTYSVIGEGGGGSGGSGAEGFSEIDEIEEEEIVYGYTKALKKSESVKIKLEGGDHSVGLLNVSNNSVIIEVSSTPQIAALSIGESKKFEITDDDFYDIKITLNSIINDRAEITIFGIHEKIIQAGREEINTEIILEKRNLLFGESLKFKANIFNFGKIPNQVNISYEVKSEERVLFSETEETVIKAYLSIRKEIDISTLREGYYDLIVNVSYEKKDFLKKEVFIIQDKSFSLSPLLEKFNFSIYNYYMLFLAGVLIFVLIIILIAHHITKRKIYHENKYIKEMIYR